MYPETMKLVSDVVETFKIAKVFSENSDRINSIDFTLDGKSLISSSDDDSIVIYDCEKGIPKRTLHSKKYGADLIRFAHNENSAVHSSTKIDDTIRYLSLHDNKYIRYFNGHVKKVVSLCMSPVDDILVSTSLDKTVRVWDLKSPNCQGLITTTSKPVACLDPEGLSIAVADSQEGLKLYDIRTFDKGPFSTFMPPNSSKRDSEWMNIKYSPNGKTILLCSNGSDVHLLDAYQGTLIHSFSDRPNPKGVPLEVSFSPDSQFVFAGSTEGTIYVWNAETGLPTAILQTGRTSAVHCVQFNPKYMLLASTTSKMAFWLPSYNEL